MNYEVFVKLSMLDAVTPVLAVLSKKFLGLAGDVSKLELALRSINRTSVAIGGAVALGAGVGMFTVIAKTALAAKDLSHELVQIKKLGIDDKQFAQVRAAAVGARQAVPGTTQVDALKAYGSMYSIFGHDNALKMMQPLSEFAQALGNTTGKWDGAFDSVAKMVRAGDLMGKFMNEQTHQVDTAALSRFLNLGAKAVVGSHGMVTPDTWFALAQQGGPALSGMTDSGLYTMAIASQMMGGSRAGTALSSMYTQFVGGKTTQATAAEMKKFGLINDYEVRRGGQVYIPEEARSTDFVKALKGDLLDAVKVLKDSLDKKGITNIDDQVPHLYEMLGRQTSQRLIHDLLRNLPQIEQERDRWTKSMDVPDSNAAANGGDLEQNLHNLSQAWKDLLATIGSSPMTIQFIQGLTNAFNGLNNFATAHPEALKVVQEASVAVAAILTTLGAAALVGAAAALVPGGAIAAAVIGIGAAIAALAAMNWQGVKSVLQGIVDAIKTFISGIAGVAGAIGKGLSDAWHAGAGALAPTHDGAGGFGAGAPHLDLAPKAGSGLGKQGWNAPPRGGDLVIHHTAMLDGDAVHKAVVRRAMAAAEHPTQAPYHDSYGLYTPPDMQSATG